MLTHTSDRFLITCLHNTRHSYESPILPYACEKCGSESLLVEVLYAPVPLVPLNGHRLDDPLERGLHVAVDVDGSDDGVVGRRSR